MGIMDTSALSPISTRHIEDELSQCYLAYAMSVIKSRALPDVRDGLKPVHRRIFYAMEDGGYTYDKPHKKSARIVGDVMGKYHPHGDSAIYEALVRMAQDWSLRHVLIDGQGNFGSPDGDPPAAMRYTEARQSRLAATMTEDLKKDTVDFTPTYDESDMEPTVLPARFPNLLVNGVQGIAVGFATEIPTHNLGEVIDATLILLDASVKATTLDSNENVIDLWRRVPNLIPESVLADMFRAMPGPDFPTGAVVMGRQGMKEAFLTGRGSYVIKGVYEIEELKGGKSQIVITELPYQVNKVTLATKIVGHVNGSYINSQGKAVEVPAEQRIEGIVDVRDESDQDVGVRLVVELKRDVVPDVVISKLLKYTELAKSYSVNATCLSPFQVPEVMGAPKMLAEFLAFRAEVVRRRTIFELEKARYELNKQIGLYAATLRVDEVVQLIRESENKDIAKQKLLQYPFPTSGGFAELLRDSDPDLEIGDTFFLNDEQARAILELRLNQLTGLEREKIAEKARDLSAFIHDCNDILNDQTRVNEIIRNEMSEIKAVYATPRLTRIEAGEFEDVNDDDLIERKPVMVVATRGGYIKYVPVDSFREQNRGGKGKNGMETREDDVVAHTVVCTTHTPLLIITSRGIGHNVKTHKLPEDRSVNGKGRPIVNFLTGLQQGETIAAIIPMPETEEECEGKYLLFITDFGDVRRNTLSTFHGFKDGKIVGINKGGKIAMRLEDEHGNPRGKLVTVRVAGEDDDLVIATKNGIGGRFPVTDVPCQKSRDGTGVKAIKLAEGDEVVDAFLLKHFEASADERTAYLAGGTAMIQFPDKPAYKVTLTPERMAEMRSAEQFILTVTATGHGKRFSNHEMRCTGRNIQGTKLLPKGNTLVGCMVVEDTDSIMMVTDKAQVIRIPVDATASGDKDSGSVIKKMGKDTRGVILFKPDESHTIIDISRVPADAE